MTKHNPIQTPFQRCDQRASAGDVSLVGLNLSATDYAILMVSRYFFASFANPKGGAWTTVILHSQDFFPAHTNSPEIVQAVLELVYKIRTSRRSVLRFSSPLCLDCANIVTAAERHIMSILQAVRGNQHSTAMTHAIMLSEGHETVGILRAAKRLVDCVKPDAP